MLFLPISLALSMINPLPNIVNPLSTNLNVRLIKSKCWQPTIAIKKIRIEKIHSEQLVVESSRRVPCNMGVVECPDKFGWANPRNRC